jgi:obg-like ATPase 1
MQFLTAKPVVYLCNIGEQEFIEQKNKWIGKLHAWIQANDTGAKLIPFSAAFEGKCAGMNKEEKTAFETEMKAKSQMPKIITTGYHALDLIHYFTVGEVEGKKKKKSYNVLMYIILIILFLYFFSDFLVRAWTIKRGTLCPAAAGVIHSDFMKFFICAESMAFVDFKEHGSEAGCKAAGKYKTQGKMYVVQDGDIMFFKHNAGGAPAAKKK